MRRTLWPAVSLVLILGRALMSCDGPNRGTNTQPSAASGFLVTVTASPNVVRPPDATTVTVKVFDRQGRLVDGAFVTLNASFNVAPTTGFTVRGIFTQVLILPAGSPRGTVIITATVEDAVATTLVTVI